MEVYEELARIAFLENDAHEYRRRWVLLRDCWLYLYDSQEEVALGQDAETVTSIDLRGALCHQHPSMERTFYLESSALYTVHGHKHKMYFRTAAEKDMQVCGGEESRPRNFEAAKCCALLCVVVCHCSLP